MDFNEIKEKDKKYYMNTFGDRLPVAFERGRGIELISTQGDVYKDFLGGIAVNALGHCHPKLTAAIHSQVDKLLHTSNYYYIEQQTALAEKLVQKSCADKVFLANSGAEANEGAIKLSKIYYYKQGKDKYEIITLDKSFHGRTLATVAATGQEKYQAPYRPLTPGFRQVRPNDFDEIKSAVSDKTAAVMIELIQGESGVHPMDAEYVRNLRKLCDEKDILLIFDEVQTGVGRTGRLFAHQLYGVEPDIFTAAKALGGGVPIGAVCAKDFVAKSFSPGDHGSTFGGNPLAAAAANAVLDILDEENLIENARVMGEYFADKLKGVSPKIKDIRCVGLLIGIEFEEKDAKAVFDKLFEKKYLTSLCKNTIRIAPPLIITKDDADGFIQALWQATEEI